MGLAPRLVLSLPPALGGDRRLRQVQPAAVVWQQGGVARVEASGRSAEVADVLTALEEEADRAGPGARAVGYFAYEFAPDLDPLVALPAPHTSPLPTAWWAVITRRGWREGDFFPPGWWQTQPQQLSCSLDDAAYRHRVEVIREAIAAGEVYQVNLTRRFSLPFVGDPAGFFLALLPQSPPRYSCFLQDLEQGWAVLCLSPELLVRRLGEAVETRPIKGTVAAPPDPRRRAAALRRLRASAKDAAELAMIVDLERNDLNRVCSPGSVQVARARSTLATVGVLHQYAVVTGRLQPGSGWRELLTALAPGGSVTGAPKLAACATIANLEPVARAVYCGALGVLQPHRGVLALPIRTGYVAGGMLHFHTGCGIVWDSQPEAEEAESRAKAAHWLAVVEEGKR